MYHTPFRKLSRRRLVRLLVREGDRREGARRDAGRRGRLRVQDDAERQLGHDAVEEQLRGGADALPLILENVK